MYDHMVLAVSSSAIECMLPYEVQWDLDSLDYSVMLQPITRLICVEWCSQVIPSYLIGHLLFPDRVVQFKSLSAVNKVESIAAFLFCFIAAIPLFDGSIHVLFYTSSKQPLAHTSHVTRHTSHVTHHTSHVTRHTPHVTRHTSHVTRHTSHATRHTSHVTGVSQLAPRHSVLHAAADVDAWRLPTKRQAV